MSKVNTRSKAKLQELMGQKPQPQMELTEAEKINFSILAEKSQQLQAEFNRVGIAIAGLVGQIVTSRGLDPKRFGVNLGVGKILPLEPAAQAPPVVQPSEDGAEEPEE